MAALDPLNEQHSNLLKQRLWGAAVLIALAVIFLPLLLDGSGSESQYRRVERLREEPPRVIDADGNSQVLSIPKKIEAAVDLTVAAKPIRPNPPAVEKPAVQPQSESASVVALTAWVVQAGSFRDQQNAVAVRDRLRRAGFPAFVSRSKSDSGLLRVRVGPMIDQQQASAARDRVMSLLGREAIVMSYP